MNRWIIDIEGNGFLKEITRIWFIVCRNIDNVDDVRVFREPDINSQPFREFSQTVDHWVGHHILGYDERVLTKFGMNGIINLENTTDTLVLSRLIYQGKPGGHSLETFGERRGIPKVIIKDFSTPSEELLKRCIEDTLINYHYYLSLEKYLKVFSRPLRVEQELEWTLSREINENGFQLDVNKLHSLHTTLSTEVDKLTSALQEVFPPKSKLLRVITPKETQYGTLSLQDFRWLPDGGSGRDLSAYASGASFSRFEYIPFNPGSPQQVVEKLNQAGWKPFEKTDGHKDEEKVTPENPEERETHEKRLAYFREYGWSISEENLATLPDEAPEAARTLVRWLMLNNRVRVIKQWFDALREDNAVHGTITGLGTWTHRCSHSDPNMGNIPSIAPKYNPNGPIYPEASALGKQLREVWIARPGRALVGTDADSIQLRVLAHYMDDEKFTQALINGDKALGTDAHSLNKQALGPVCNTRDVAKTLNLGVYKSF